MLDGIRSQFYFFFAQKCVPLNHNLKTAIELEVNENNMKPTLSFFLSLLLTTCVAPKNQLIGTWEFDGERTLIELEKSKNAPEKILICYRERVCGHNVTLTFTRDTWLQKITTTKSSSSEEISYEIVRLSNSEIEISTKLQGVESNYVTYFINSSLAYTYSEIDGFKWKEYLKKKH